jgi:hypothetical protein
MIKQANNQKYKFKRKTKKKQQQLPLASQTNRGRAPA